MTARTTTDAIWLHLSFELRQFIRRRVSDDHVADDLLQETFMRVHRNIRTLQDGERLAAWVYQIARNVVHDHHRSIRNSTVALADLDTFADQDDHDLQVGRGNTTWLNEMVQSLPDGYREALQLAEIEEQSQQEVADRLGLSLSGAKSRIQRGRVMLKNVLESCCTFELDGRGRIIACDPKADQKVCRNCGS